MTRHEKKLFDKEISTARQYLEFGMGGSTLRALQKSTAIIYSVESDAQWIQHMRKYHLIRTSETCRLHIFPVDIGATKKFGYPTSSYSKELFPHYSSSVFSTIEYNNLDMVLIDGRFRVACALHTILSCSKNPTLKILIDDFWDRPKYHILLHYLQPIEQADAMGLFTIKTDVDLKQVQHDYETYKYIPD